jgi:hypothetical protein
MASTFFQALSAAVAQAVDNEPNKSIVKGYSKEQIVQTVKSLTEALGDLPPETSLHVVLFSLNFVRNAVIAAMEDNQKALESRTGGNT